MILACERCGEEFERPRKVGRLPKNCVTCGIAKYGRWYLREKVSHLVRAVPCAICERLFFTQRAGRPKKYCSECCVEHTDPKRRAELARAKEEEHSANCL